MNLPLESEEASPVLDAGLFQELRESLGSELHVVAGIYTRFLGNAARSLEESRRQAGATRAATLHTLKGSAAMVGATRIARVAGRLQESLLGAPAEVAEAAFRELEGELALFRDALGLHLESLGYQGKR
jgi:HPt (histidine-containing phosphotransfer) domain-containing protein